MIFGAEHLILGADEELFYGSSKENRADSLAADRCRRRRRSLLPGCLGVRRHIARSGIAVSVGEWAEFD
jgi:hypothetical protein